MYVLIKEAAESSDCLLTIKRWRAASICSKEME